MEKNKVDSSGYKTGSLPANAPLAAAYVPMQRSASPSYDANAALSRGTLFPGLLALKEEARERYVKLCGPVGQTDMLGMNSYVWLDNPWPWDYQPQMEV